MRVLLLHATIGWGHKRAALAVQEELNRRSIPAEVVDMLDFLPGPLPRLYPWAYSFMITRARWLWRWFYNWNDRGTSLYTPALDRSQRWQFRRLLEFIEAGNFTHAVSTHFTSAALLADWRKERRWDLSIYSVVTDFISHRCWKRKELDQYFVATEEVQQQMHDCGIPLEKITVTGIPISMLFGQSLSRSECRSTWHCAEDEKLILVLSSGLNTAKTRALIQDLRDLQGKNRYLVSAGKDAPREQLVREFCAGDDRFEVFGFSSRIAEMMKAADILLSKPGGLTTSEALACGLPQILFSPIPGQEEANAEYVTKTGAGLCIEAGRGAFRDALSSLLSRPDQLMAMQQNAAKLGRPAAAARICDIVTAGTPLAV